MAASIGAEAAGLAADKAEQRRIIAGTSHLSQDLPHHLSATERATYAAELAFIDSFCDSAAARFERFRERQVLLSRMRLNFGRRFSRVRIDANHIDAFGLIILGQLLHPIVVAVGHWTTGCDEDNDRAILALQ